MARIGGRPVPERAVDRCRVAACSRKPGLGSAGRNPGRNLGKAAWPSFGPDGLCLAAKTVEQFVARARPLYEQEPGEAKAPRFGLYLRRWVRWTGAGLPEVRTAVTTLSVVRAA